MPLPEAEPASCCQVLPLYSLTYTCRTPPTSCAQATATLLPSVARARSATPPVAPETPVPLAAPAPNDTHEPPVNCLTKTFGAPPDESSQAMTGPAAVLTITGLAAVPVALMPPGL